MSQFARAVSVALLLLGGLIAPIAAVRAADPEEVFPLYWQALRHQCPVKQLDLLAPADLRDVLDGYKAGPGAALKAKLDRAERHACSGSFAGAGCDNLADLRLLEKRRQIGAVVHAVCGHFAMCHSQSECEAAAP